MTESDLAPEKIIINGQEFSPEDATQLIELGNKYKKIESDLNTSLDKVYPEYTRASQQLKEKEKLLAERDAELEALRQSREKEKALETPEDVKKIREAARQVGLADTDYLKEQGYMTKDEVKAYLDEQEKLKQAAQGVMDQANALAKEIDGSDGRVKFNPKAVMAYAYVNGKNDLREAYEEMNAEDNVAWKQKQLEEAERAKGLTTLKAGGKKEPQRTKITNDNLGQALGEWLNGIPE